MRKQCECELPYVDMKESTTCVHCRGMNIKGLINNSERTQKRINMDGSEYKTGDIVEVLHGHYWCYVKIIKYTGGGWYQVRLPNGGVYETQILGNIIRK